MTEHTPVSNCEVEALTEAQFLLGVERLLGSPEIQRRIASVNGHTEHGSPEFYRLLATVLIALRDSSSAIAMSADDLVALLTDTSALEALMLRATELREILPIIPDVITYIGYKYPLTTEQFEDWGK